MLKKKISENEYGNYQAYDGTNHNVYDPEKDESILEMTKEELLEHYRIIGHEPNQLPAHIKKLI